MTSQEDAFTIHVQLEDIFRFCGPQKPSLVRSHEYFWEDIPSDWLSSGEITLVGREGLLKRIYGADWETNFHNLRGLVRPVVLCLNVTVIPAESLAFAAE